MSKGHDNLLDQERSLLFRLTGEDDFLRADQFYFAELTPINGSTVSGAAVFAYDVETNQLTVLLGADGLEPNRAHVQHIHGFVDGREAHEPTLAADTDDDGYIEGAEGGAVYGPVIFGLPTTNNATGEQFIVQTFQLPANSVVAGELLGLREYNIHGVTLPEGAGEGTTGEADGGPAVYSAGIVAAGGEIDPVTSLGQLNSVLARSGVKEQAFDLHDGWAVA